MELGLVTDRRLPPPDEPGGNAPPFQTFREISALRKTGHPLKPGLVVETALSVYGTLLHTGRAIGVR